MFFIIDSCFHCIVYYYYYHQIKIYYTLIFKYYGFNIQMSLDPYHTLPLYIMLHPVLNSSVCRPNPPLDSWNLGYCWLSAAGHAIAIQLLGLCVCVCSLIIIGHHGLPIIHILLYIIIIIIITLLLLLLYNI